jgi:hypothetical protein
MIEHMRLKHKINVEKIRLESGNLNYLAQHPLFQAGQVPLREILDAYNLPYSYILGLEEAVKREDSELRQGFYCCPVIGCGTVRVSFQILAHMRDRH